MKTILVIDDEQDVYEFVRAVFANHPEYRVLGATRALQGLELAHSLRPDVILLDFLLPGISGVKLLQRLGDWPSTAHIPVLLMSGMGASEPLFRHLAFDAAGYLIKPFSAIELTRKIDGLFDRRAASQPRRSDVTPANTAGIGYQRIGRRDLD